MLTSMDSQALPAMVRDVRLGLSQSGGGDERTGEGETVNKVVAVGTTPISVLYAVWRLFQKKKRRKTQQNLEINKIKCMH